MAWQPQPQGLEQLVQTFTAATSGDNAVQSKVLESLQAFHKEPDFSNYCVILFCDEQRDIYIRSQAGLALKNHILFHFSSMVQQNIDFIKAHIIRNIGDANKQIRNATGAVISGLIRSITLYRWPEILPSLNEYMAKSDQASVEGSLSVLKVLMEDCPADLNNDSDGSKPLANVIPGVMNFIESSEVSIRAISIEILTLAITSKISVMDIFMETFINHLFHRVQDPSPLVHKELCRAFVNILTEYHQLILPNLNHIAEYMFKMTQVDDEEVALEACEFWLAIAEHQQVYEYLRPFIGGLIPVLIKGMVYSEDEIIELEESMADTSVPDRDQDVRPHHHQGREHGHVRNEGAPNDDFEDDEDDNLEDDYDTRWNLRKCSAAALDQLSTIFKNDILEVLLPLVNEKLHHQEWSHRECGILALGAIAEGCITGITPHLPNLIDYLLNSLNDAHGLVRSISCWTLSRYADWYVSEPADPNEDRKLARVLEGLLLMSLDNNKRVQEAGCSAFTILENAAGVKLIPYLEPIIAHLVMAFSKYQRKNMFLLYDALSSLAFAVGSKLNHQPYIDSIMPPLIQKWNELADDNTDLFPLFECLSALICAIGPGFLPYISPVYQRCIRISALIMQQDQVFKADPNQPEPDKDFLIVSLDLLSGIVQGLGEKTFDLSNTLQPPLMNIIASSMMDDNNEVCQSAYAAIGDLTISCTQLIQPHYEEIIKHMINSIKIYVQFPNLCNNVIWSSGEIALKWGAGMQPYITPLLQAYIPLLNDEHTARTLGENLAISIARFGLVTPELVSPHLQHFSRAWCKALVYIDDNLEKDSAFQGMCVMARQNPSGLHQSFPHFCLAVERFKSPSDQCQNQIKEVLHMYKGLSGPAWDQFIAGLGEPIHTDLRTRFGV